MTDNPTGPDNDPALVPADTDAPSTAPADGGASADIPTTLIGMLTDRSTVALIVSTLTLLTVWYCRFDFVWLPDVAREARLGWFGANLVLLFIVPTLVMRLGYGMTLADLGVRVGDWRASIRYALIFGGITIPLILLSSRWQAYQHYYSNYMQQSQALTVILIGMAGWLVYFFAWEFHFRGFLLGALQKRFGALAIIIQTVPFVMMHFGKPSSESLAAVVAGIALGWWAYRSRSCLGPWLLHWVCSATMQLAVAFWPVPPPPV